MTNFAPIALIGRQPNILVVSPSPGISSVSELVAMAKAKPGQLNFGSSGRGTAAHLAGELFRLRANKGGGSNPGFQALLRLLDSGRCWVELTGPYRISAVEFPYPDVTPMAHALVAAAAERLLWGTDWPHVMMKKRMPNDADITDLLLGWVPDIAHQQTILVDNPPQLYGFD